MSDEKKPHNHDKPDGDREMGMIDFELFALGYIDAFINLLPTEYRYIAIFVRLTAADPEVAVALEVKAFWDLCSQLGRMRAIESLARVPLDPDVEYLLPIYINGRRAELLKRKSFDRKEPPQVYLDSDGRPIPWIGSTPLSHAPASV